LLWWHDTQTHSQPLPARADQRVITVLPSGAGDHAGKDSMRLISVELTRPDVKCSHRWTLFSSANSLSYGPPKFISVDRAKVNKAAAVVIVAIISKEIARRRSRSATIFCQTALMDSSLSGVSRKASEVEGQFSDYVALRLRASLSLGLAQRGKYLAFVYLYAVLPKQSLSNGFFVSPGIWSTSNPSRMNNTYFASAAERHA